MYKNYRSKYQCDISELVGKTLIEATALNDELYLITSDGWKYVFHHEQSCCENVYIESIVGELDDLLDETILLAEEVDSSGVPPNSDYEPESWTWTFYKFATRKGYVDIRWYGTSNGYYSESVSLYKVNLSEEVL